MHFLYKISFYISVFLTNSASFGMKHPEDNIIPSIIISSSEEVAIEKYKEIVAPLENGNNKTLNQKTLETIYTKLSMFIKDVNDEKTLDKRTILNFSLPNGKSLIHHLIRLSQYSDFNLDSFFNLFLPPNLADDLNIQDENGNTPLLDAFIKNPETGEITLTNFTIVKLLLHHGANPIIENNQKISPEIMIKKFSDQNNLNEIEKMHAEHLLCYCWIRQAKRF